MSISYLGGPVLHTSRTYAIFWAPAGSGLSFDPGYVALVTQFLRDVAHDSHLTTQRVRDHRPVHRRARPAVYSSTYAGDDLDVDPLPSNGCTEPAQTGPGWSVCLTDAQMQAELAARDQRRAAPARRRTRSI